MGRYTFKRVKNELFAVYHAIYSENVDFQYDWNERLQGLLTDSYCGFLYEDENPIGGFAIGGNEIGSPFLIVPFSDRSVFWRQAIAAFMAERGGPEIQFRRLQQSDVEALTVLGATTKWSHRRMCRPTDSYEAKRVDGFQLATPNMSNLPEIVQVVYNAHANGYTTKVYGARSIREVEEAIRRRYDLFTGTHTWNQSVVAKRIDTNEIAGVCIAGVYPDSPNHFATIHQISVLPEYSGRGLATAMMLRSIHLAHRVSPVIGLQVLIGNPAEDLYRKLGFAAGPCFSDMIYTL